MSDPTPDPRDEVLRAALRAEAEGVTADPDLLARIHAASPPAGSARRMPWLLVAAVAAVVVGLGAAVALRDDDQQLDAVNDPTATTTTEHPSGRDMFDVLSGAFPCQGGYQTVVYLSPDISEADADAVRAALEADDHVATFRFVSEDEVAAALAAAAPEAEWDPASIPTAYLTTSASEEDDLAMRGAVSDLAGVAGTSSTDCGSTPPPTGGHPTLAALVRQDGWLVTVDLQTGEERELYFGGDPNASSEVEEGGPAFIDAVELSPDQQWVYFSTCCEPASGQSYRIPVAGGEPQLVAAGGAPRVSPDGTFIATGGSTMVIVGRTDRAEGTVVTVEVACCARSSAWSPDGTQLAVVVGSGAPGAGYEVLLFDWDGTNLTAADTGKPSNPGSFVSWTPDGTLSISSGGPVDDDLGLSQDASYRWLLWIDEAGVVREQAGQESGARDAIAGLPAAIAADW